MRRKRETLNIRNQALTFGLQANLEGSAFCVFIIDVKVEASVYEAVQWDKFPRIYKQY